MAPNRYYSSNAVETTLTTGINNTNTSIAVASATGYPTSVPFTVHVDLGNSSEEIMTVTAVSGLTFTVTRGSDGSPALPHSVGAKVVHGVSARDFQEPQDHLGNAANVHGVTGNLVGETTTQTLTNKTLGAPTINGATLSGGGTWNNGPQHDHSADDKGGKYYLARMRQRRAATMNLINDTLTNVGFDATDYDVGNWSPGGTWFRLPVTGFYVLFAYALFQNQGTNGGVRLVQLRRTGDNQQIGETSTSAPGGSSTNWQGVQVATLYMGTAAEQVSVALSQTSGGTLTVNNVACGGVLLAAT